MPCRGANDKGDRDHGQHGQDCESDFALGERKPNQRLRAEQFCERKENADPQERPDGGDERKAAYWHRKQTSGEISRQTRAWNEAAGN